MDDTTDLRTSANAQAFVAQADVAHDRRALHAPPRRDRPGPRPRPPLGLSGRGRTLRPRATYHGATGFERAEAQRRNLQAANLSASVRQELGDDWTLRLGPLTHSAAWAAIRSLHRPARFSYEVASAPLGARLSLSAANPMAASGCASCVLRIVPCFGNRLLPKCSRKLPRQGDSDRVRRAPRCTQN